MSGSASLLGPEFLQKAATGCLQAGVWQLSAGVAQRAFHCAWVFGGIRAGRAAAHHAVDETINYLGRDGIVVAAKCFRAGHAVYWVSLRKGRVSSNGQRHYSAKYLFHNILVGLNGLTVRCVHLNAERSVA